MFGTDHPFFPPHVANADLDSTEWHSPAAHRTVLKQLGPETETAVLSGNAIATLGLSLPG
jgi:hypothetical protein